jgi:hypothetical protein
MLVFVLNQVLVYSSMCVMGRPSWHTLYLPLKTNETGRQKSRQRYAGQPQPTPQHRELHPNTIRPDPEVMIALAIAMGGILGATGSTTVRVVPAGL